MVEKKVLTPRELARKARLSPDMDGSRTYRSKQVSVFAGSSLADGPVKRDTVETPAAPQRRRVINSDRLRTSDVYYRNGGEHAREYTPTPKTPKDVKTNAAVAPISGFAGLVSDKATLKQAVEQAVHEVLAGVLTKIVIAHGNTKLMMQARTAIEQRVTRQQITEDQGRDITLAYATEPSEAGETAAHVAEVPELSADLQNVLDVVSQAEASAEEPLSQVEPDKLPEDDGVPFTADTVPADAPPAADILPAEDSLPADDMIPAEDIHTADAVPAGDLAPEEAAVTEESPAGENIEETPKRPISRGRRSGRGA